MHTNINHLSGFSSNRLWGWTFLSMSMTMIRRLMTSVCFDDFAEGVISHKLLTLIVLIIYQKPSLAHYYYFIDKTNETNERKLFRPNSIRVVTTYKSKIGKIYIYLNGWNLPTRFKNISNIICMYNVCI